jgi:hypothetical protein
MFIIIIIFVSLPCKVKLSLFTANYVLQNKEFSHSVEKFMISRPQTKGMIPLAEIETDLTRFCDLTNLIGRYLYLANQV